MNRLDLIILAVTVLMAVWGYSQGLVVGLFALAGLGVGAWIGSRLGPLVLADGADSSLGPLFALAGALIVGGILASAFEVAGYRLRGRFLKGFGMVDGLGGAALIACVALGLAWIAGGVAQQARGLSELRRDVRESVVLGTLNDTLPSSGPLLNALARFDPFPRIEGPSPEVGRPSGAIVRDPQVRAARRSLVKVLGTACGLGVEGSGWVAADGIVVTNAHVVAGQRSTTVQVGGSGPHHDAEVIHFDRRNDVAILRASGIRGVPALPIDTDAKVGTSAAIMGFPNNGTLDIRAGRLGQTATFRTQDAYGRGGVRRRITVLRGRVRQGNSGGPMVDGDGEVVTTIFAASVGNSRRGGYGVPDSVVSRALASALARGTRVSSGRCAS